MKLSDWIKNYDWQFPENKLRAIDCNDLLNITEFDISLQHGKSVEVPYISCKHTIKYTLFDSSNETSDRIKNIEDNSKSSLKSFVETLINPREVYYHELTEEFKKGVDEGWNRYNPTRCDQNCKNIVIDNT